MKIQSLLNLISFIVVMLLGIAAYVLLQVTVKALAALIVIVFVIWIIWKLNTFKSVKKEE